MSLFLLCNFSGSVILQTYYFGVILKQLLNDELEY